MLWIKNEQNYFDTALISGGALTTGATVTVDLYAMDGTKVVTAQALTEVSAGIYTGAVTKTLITDLQYRSVYTYDGTIEITEDITVSPRNPNNEATGSIVGIIQDTKTFKGLGQNQYSMVRGEARTMNVQLIISDLDYLSFDLSGRSNIQIVLPAADSSTITLDETGGEIAVINEDAGQLAVTIDSTNSALLKSGDRMDFQVNVLYSVGGPKTAYFKGRLNVQEEVGC